MAAPTLGFLEELPVEQAVQLLEGEEVTLLAAVLFALSPKKAAAIAERIPVARRVQMFQVLASIEDLSDATLDHIRQRLERKLEFGNDLHARPEGLHRARQLLEQLSPGVQRGIADALAVHSPQLASELHRNVFRINDLPRLHRHDLEKVVRLIAPDVLGAALKHADNRVREFVLAVLPTAGAQELAQHLETLEIDRQASSDAQQQIVDVVHELFRKRIITRPRTETTLRRAA